MTEHSQSHGIELVAAKAGQKLSRHKRAPNEINSIIELWTQYVSKMLQGARCVGQLFWV
jgi:hypothetical protein